MAAAETHEKIFVGNIQKSCIMRIKDGFKLRPLLKENIVMADGSGSVDFNKLISLNSTAAFLWKKVQGREFCERELADMLCEEYDVSEEQASADVSKLIGQFREAGLLDE